MFIRKKKNRSGSVSIQIVSKAKRRYEVVKTIGCATMLQEIERLELQARQELKTLMQQAELFESEHDKVVEAAFSLLHNSSIRTIGPELVFGRIFDYIGFGQIQEEMFRHLVIARLAFPLSKLKTVEYLHRYQGVNLEISAVYRHMDKLNSKLKGKVEQIAYAHTRRVLGGDICIVFYDMTTLYFEAADEDDLRKTGFSKDGKHQNPQIYIGLLVGPGGYAIGYDIYEGDTFEGDTLIPFLENISSRFDIGKPVVVADAGLLSDKNIRALEERQYQYIIGARLKNETEQIKQQMAGRQYSDGAFFVIKKEKGRRLIVHYSAKRAAKDAYNRERGLKRLEKRMKSGRLNKSNINNRGYNKYLRLTGEITIEIDYDKFNQDKVWDGLKGYITNTPLKEEQILENYKNLWHIERAFRMSKTDLRIRPIYHRLRRRIEAHICISFTAYAIYKELERVLKEENSSLSLIKASELTHNIYQITYMLPDSKHIKTRVLKMDQQQQELINLITKNF